MMSFESMAQALAAEIRASGCGFVTLRRDELRDRFQIGKFTGRQTEEIEQALRGVDLFVHPSPYSSDSRTLRVYDKRHPLGEVARAVAVPDLTVETPLTRAVATFAREAKGRELRSDDVPWIEAFWIYLQLVLGREPEGWEDVRDDRHGTMLARQLGLELGLGSDVGNSGEMQRIAAAVCTGRVRTMRWRAADFAVNAEAAPHVRELLAALQGRDRRAREEHEKVLRAAARVALAGQEIPNRDVELGLLGLVRRHDHGSEG